MVYNTRRKSLSLPSLGIHLPQSSRSTGVAPPLKRVKRDHSPGGVVGFKLPPSPPPESRISHEGINDDIVSGVVEVLERSGNRPHTVKELAAELAGTVGVENSANPHAIISSRLNTYLKRSQSSKPLLSKQLITTHPKRIYFYLATSPHQPIPHLPLPQPLQSPQPPQPTPTSTPTSTPTPTPTPTPSDTEEDIHRRRTLSPSPEVDLDLSPFSPNPCSSSTSTSISTTPIPSPLCAPAPTQISTVAIATTTTTVTTTTKSALTSPPLEGDEQEFSQSAIYILRRARSREASFPPSPSLSSSSSEKRVRGEYEPEEVILFAAGGHTLKGDEEDAGEGLGFGSWNGELERGLGSPESVGLSELDELLDF